MHRNGYNGCVIWFTGLSGAGKTTLAQALQEELAGLNRQSYVLDGDLLRRGLCSDLGFSPEDRRENIRRVAEVAKLFADAGLICITALISPYRRDRDFARSILPQGSFMEVYLSAPLEVCERRDPKGLYRKARSGELKDFTGISAPYEPPLQPELEVPTDQLNVAACVSAILEKLKRQNSNTHRPQTVA